MARTEIKITATFKGATRKGSSANGNPTWILHTDEGDFTTETDAQIGYTVSNYTHSVHGFIGKRVVLTATKGRRVFDVKPACLPDSRLPHRSE